MNLLCDVELDVLSGKIVGYNFRNASTPGTNQTLITELLGNPPTDWGSQDMWLDDLQCYRVVADGTIDGSGNVTCSGIFTWRDGTELNLLPRRKEFTIKTLKSNAKLAFNVKYENEMDKALGYVKKHKAQKQSDFDDDIDTIKGFIETKEDQINACTTHAEVLAISLEAFWLQN